MSSTADQRQETLDMFAGLAAGLDLTDSDDRALLRTRVARKTDRMVMTAIITHAANVGRTPSERSRAAAQRALADGLIDLLRTVS
jgi:hypothetical protein